MAAKPDPRFKLVADNRKARFHYAIGEVFEAGIVLTGSEVKSMRAGKTSIAESYATSRDGELWLLNSNISEYKQAGRYNHEPKRPRKLLLHQRQIGMLIVPRLTQLDMTGPYEVLARLPNTKVLLVAHTMAPVKTDRGMEIVPTITLADCPQLDLVMVPGGAGQQDLMEDAVVLEFLRKQAAGAKYVTSVCTGSLVLGAAGLLKGRRATCHWTAIEHL